MNFNRLIPELSVSDFDRSLWFYTKVLGFTIQYQRPEHHFAFINLEGSQIMIEQYNGYWDTAVLEYPYGRGMNLSIEVEKLDHIIQAMHAHSFPIKLGPEENWYRRGEEMLGDIEVLLLDPDGYLLRFIEHLSSRPVENK
ncbi:VOC family protein [Virgibacillus kimchii]